MKADPQDQLRLLQVQDCDTRLAQLTHRDKTLPEAQALREAEQRQEQVHDDLVRAQTAASDLASEVARAEADVVQVRERMSRDQRLMDSGEIGDPKQLTSLQHELTSLVKRLADLEDVELEVMERQEAADKAVAQLQQEQAGVAEQIAALVAEVADLRAAIVADRAGVEADRAAAVQGLPADLLALYDKVRADHDGVGAAPLYRGRCEGCRLQLPPQEIEVARSAAADEVLRCEECRRILVRTPESGL